MTFGSLFSGIGGLDLGLKRAGMRCIWQCEIDPFARRVLAKHWPGIPCYEDVRSIDGDVERPDLLCGGFPCQDISSSGGKAGIRGTKSGLWFEFSKVIRLLRPRFVLVENVSAILSRGMDTVLGDLASVGYDAEWHCLSAADFGSPQGRDRCWIVAHADGRGFPVGAECDRPRAILEGRLDDDGLALAQRRAGEAPSRIRRMGHGVPHGVDRLRVLGNAVVPQVAQFIGERILAADALTRPEVSHA